MGIMEVPTPDTRGVMIQLTKGTSCSDTPPGASPVAFQHSTSASATQTDLDRKRDDKVNNDDGDFIDNHADDNDNNDKSEVIRVNKKSVSCVLI